MQIFQSVHTGKCSIAGMERYGISALFLNNKLLSGTVKQSPVSKADFRYDRQCHKGQGDKGVKIVGNTHFMCQL